MKRKIITIGMVALILLSGCSSVAELNSDETTTEEPTAVVQDEQTSTVPSTTTTGEATQTELETTTESQPGLTNLTQTQTVTETVTKTVTPTATKTVTETSTSTQTPNPTNTPTPKTTGEGEEERTFTIKSTGDGSVTYVFGSTKSVEFGNKADVEGADNPDTIADGQVTGFVGKGGADSYDFIGTITRFRVISGDGVVEVFIDGQSWGTYGDDE